MLRPRTPARFRLLPFALVTTAVLACAGQAEGERCDNLAGGSPPGTADCQSGLTCQLHSMVYICCPADLGQAKTPACSPGGGEDASPAPTPAAGAEAGTEAAAADALVE